MGPQDAAQNAEIETNRRLLTSVIDMQVTQNASLAQIVDAMISAFGELKAGLEDRNIQMALALNDLANDLDQRAADMLRKSAVASLEEAAADIRKAAKKLDTMNSNKVE